MSFRRLCALVFCFALLLSGAAGAAVLPVEVVQSVPLETTLEVPGIRNTQQVWLDMIHGAKRTIDIEQFYISTEPGQAMEPVLQGVVAAAEHGVQVRLILDSSFYKMYPGPANQLSKIANIQVRIIDFSKLGGIQHAKYFVVDGTEEYVGSANFDWLSLTHIHEIGLHLADSKVSADLESIFETDWKVAAPLNGASAANPIRPPVEARPRILNGFQVAASPSSVTPRSIPDTLQTIVRMMASAKKSIKIQMYQYSTRGAHAESWRVLDSAMRSAAARGVQVQLMVDAVSMKSSGNDLRSLRDTGHVQVGVVTIPQFSGGPIAHARLIHSKYMLIDDAIAWVGSENWSENYFTGSRNVGVVFQQPQVAGALHQVFDRVWTSSYTAH